MPYQNVSDAAMIASTRMYVPVNDVRSFCNTLPAFNFSVVAQRQAAMNALNTLAQHGIVVDLTTDRFPSGVYVDWNANDLFTTTDNIMNVLAYRDMQKDSADAVRSPVRGGPATESEKDKQVGWHYNDAHNSFYKNVSSLNTFLNNPNVLMYRSKFERMYGLTWQDPPQPREAQP